MTTRPTARSRARSRARSTRRSRTAILSIASAARRTTSRPGPRPTSRPSRRVPARSSIARVVPSRPRVVVSIASRRESIPRRASKDAHVRALAARVFKLSIVKHIHRPIRLVLRVEVHLGAPSPASIHERLRVRHAPRASKFILDVSPRRPSRHILHLDLMVALPRHPASTARPTRPFIRSIASHSPRVPIKLLIASQSPTAVPAVAAVASPLASRQFHPKPPTVERVPISPPRRLPRLGLARVRHERVRRRTRGRLEIHALDGTVG